MGWETTSDVRDIAPCKIFWTIEIENRFSNFLSQSSNQIYKKSYSNKKSLFDWTIEIKNSKSNFHYQLT